MNKSEEEEKLNNYIAEISSGNEEALEEFYREYGHTMMSLIISVVRTRESAEEVMQDVLMNIVNYGSSRPKRNIRGWLFSIILNESKKRYKLDKKKQNDSLPDDQSDSSPDCEPENIENSIDQIEALGCLDELEREIVILSVFGQNKLPQVALLLGLPYNKVRNKYGYAMKKLKKYYEERR